MGWSSGAQTVRRVVASCVVGVLVAGASATSAARLPGPVAAGGSETGGGLPLVDVTSAERTSDGYLFTADDVEAATLAAATGEPYELITRRTERESFFRLPDGSMATIQSAAPQWVRLGGDGTHLGDWAAVDPSLEVRADGSVGTVATPGSTGVSAGGPGSADAPLELAWTVAEDGARQSVLFEGSLPVPQVQGARAVYEGVNGPGLDGCACDLVVETNRTGFAVFLVVNERPRGEVSIPLRVATTKGQIRPGADGGLEFLDAAGQVSGVMPAPMMWDAIADADRPRPVTVPWVDRGPEEAKPLIGADEGGVSTAGAERVAKAAAEADTRDLVEGDWVETTDWAAGTTVGQARKAAASSPAPESDRQVAVAMTVEPVASSVRMSLRPDTAFLSDEDTTYPVVVDPDFPWRGMFDTWVQNDSTEDKSGDTELRLGTHNGSVVARSYLGPFGTTGLYGARITHARVSLWNHTSFQCVGASDWQIGHASSASISTRWTSQPAWHSFHHASSEVKGYAGCDDGWVSILVHTPIQWAADNHIAEMSWVLKAVNEGATSGWKRFGSAQSAYPPYMLVIWEDRAPSGPTDYKLTDPHVPTCSPSGPGATIATTTPVVSWKVSDPDDSTVIGNLDIKDASTGGFAWDMEARPEQGSGSTFGVRVPKGKLLAGRTYLIQTGGQDADTGVFGTMSSCYYTVDVTKPDQPTITPTMDTTFGVSALGPGSELRAGQRIVSPDGRFWLVMQLNGNLALYGPSGWLWQAYTYGTAGSRLAVQNDGNLVIYTPAGEAVWSSGTGGRAITRLEVQSGGNLVLYNGQSVVWQSNTWGQPATPVEPAPEVLYVADQEHGGVGVAGRWSIRTTDPTVVEVAYSFGSATYGPPATPDVNGLVTATYTPDSAGPITLYVTARDAAGNESVPKLYTFDVAEAAEDGIWLLDEGIGSTSAQEPRIGGHEPNPLTLFGGTGWADGPHADFKSRLTDKALVLDGSDDYAATAGQVVDTTKSFTVAARVWLDPLVVNTAHRTAVAQDGDRASGFYLQYTPAVFCPSPSKMPNGCWTMVMVASDGSSVRGFASSAAVAGEWVTIVGEYNAAAPSVRLWVCEAGTLSSPKSGQPSPVKETGLGATPSWGATGPLTIGRALSSGNPSDFWKGRIGDVRVFSDKVVSTAKIRRLCQGAEASDFPNGTGPLALDPTVPAAGQ